MEKVLGQIQLFAFNFEPSDWMICEGRSLPINQYMAVFSLLGTTYGGDGKTHLARPNLKGKEPIAGSVYCICMEGTFPSRQ
ncbi:tail fiber protein [Paracidovorax wautersii]|uniref:phage tail protein n=1 Tax=Paracidovorax wautersii TaxID=1177982 RepID=UPI0031E00E01